MAHSSLSLAAEKFEPNYDESKVPEYTLPDPLVLSNGEKVTDAKTWKEVRRPEILNLFAEEVYGKTPEAPDLLRYQVIETSDEALDGKAIRKQVRIFFTQDKADPKMDLLIYLPKGAEKPFPLMIGLNFYGNHTIHSDPAIILSDSWMRKNEDKGIVDNRATEDSRGASADRWAVDMILDRGYGLATAYYGDIDPDFDDGFQNGIQPLFYKEGQNKPAPDEWGSIGAWAYGLSRAMDYFEQDEDINENQVAVMGHSRLGKTSLWAGAQDERFAIVISNDSGCGGAALSRRRFGETVARINNVFPHWFCDNFNKYNDNESALPVDQHMLIALIAPRPAYVASAVDDRWADPKGEFLSVVHAEPVYQLLGEPGFGSTEMPEVDHPIMDTLGYHIRTGGHNVTDFDWKAYLDFADKHFGR
ncbi:MAG: acetylxylan esterase [Candidatus Omnitrophica bacterium]|nr:acetylxylan esterase [Candidatus Omnitrophota bacterium]